MAIAFLAPRDPSTTAIVEIVTTVINIAQLSAVTRKSMEKIIKAGQELDIGPPEADCRWVEPGRSGIYASPSTTFSMLALITCVTTNIPMKALFRAWWTFINTVAKPAYNKNPTYSLPFRVAAMWVDLKKQSDICYRIRGVNYLQTIFEFNGCQCSCGTAMLFDIMKSIDPNVKMTTVYSPGHVAVAVYDENNVPWIVETTTTEMFVTKYDATDPKITKEWTLEPEEHTQLIHLQNWMRIFMEPFKNTKNETALWNIMCQLHTIFELMPARGKTLASRIFRCFAGYAHAVVDQNPEEAQEMKSCFVDWTEDLNHDKFGFLKYNMEQLETQINMYKRAQKRGTVIECKKTGTPTEQKKLQTFQRYYLAAPNYDDGKETEIMAEHDEVLKFVEDLRNQNVLDQQKQYQKKTLKSTVKQFNESDDFDPTVLSNARRFIVQKALQLKKECMTSKNCGDFPGESAVRLAAAMLLYNPRIFLQGASAYMKYIDQNKISPESLKATSNWVEDAEIFFYNLESVENALEQLEPTHAKYEKQKETFAKQEDSLGLKYVEGRIVDVEATISTYNKLHDLLTNDETSHYFQ
jgi:hypothetical protein